MLDFPGEMSREKSGEFSGKCPGEFSGRMFGGNCTEGFSRECWGELSENAREGNTLGFYLGKRLMGKFRVPGNLQIAVIIWVTDSICPLS